MKKRYLRSVLNAALLVSLLLLVSCSKSKKEADEHAAEQPEKKRIEVTEEARKKSGIAIEVAGPAVLKKTLKLNGKIGPNEERMVHVSPRFPGIVKSIAKRLGDVVKTGEALAVIESNESLQPYEVKSEIDGTIIKRDIALGEFVDTSKTIFIVADLSNVWVDFSVYRHESESLGVGQKVLIQPSVCILVRAGRLQRSERQCAENGDLVQNCEGTHPSLDVTPYVGTLVIVAVEFEPFLQRHAIDYRDGHIRFWKSEQP